MSTEQSSTGLARRARAVRSLAGGAAIALGVLLTLQPAPAAGQSFILQLEPAAALWLDAPQKDRFTPGVYAAVRPGVALGQFTSLQMSYAFLYAPSDSDFDDAGSAHMLSAGVRFRPLAALRPPTEQLGGLWADFNIGYVRTGDLDRLGFDAGLGYGFQVSPTFALGPSVRYVQVVQPNDREDEDGSDARILALGLNFSFGPAYRPEEVEVIERIIYEPALECTEAECVQEPCVQETCPALPTSTCVDTDGDGICDDVDRCPLQPGPASTYGCPTNPCDGTPLQVLVQFEHDSAAMPVRRAGDTQTMDPVLDAVAAAIAQDSTCRVGIIGHTSEEGDDDHNQRLSEARARAVQQYLVSRGVSADRIPTTGMGSRCQLSPERSRVLNRRVQFFRLEEGASMPTQCLP